MAKNVSFFGSLVDLVKQLREDRIAYWRDSSMPGFRALLVYRTGCWVSAQGPLLRRLLFPLYRAAYRWVRNHYGIDLYYTAKVGRRVILANQGNIEIHKNAVIGNDCVIRQNVTIGAVTGSRIEQAPVLEDGVEVGAGAVILGRVRVGAGARIGPNVVVMTDIPARAIVVTPPPRVLLPTSVQQTSRLEHSGDLEARMATGMEDSDNAGEWRIA